MIVTAALIWYDERLEELEACVRGMANIADRVVAVDGAYRRYPGAKAASPPEQAELIRSTAADVGMEAKIHVPRHSWAGQVEKRSFVLSMASIDTDWIAIVDTDWVIHANRKAARRELEAYREQDVDVISVNIVTPPGEADFATNWHRDVAGGMEVPHIFRPLPGLKVETRHWWYSAQKNGHKVWMWHGPAHTRKRILPWHSFKTKYIIEHRFRQRDERHILENRAFCNDREMVLARTGQEDDAPGLPPPSFDFDTVPY